MSVLHLEDNLNAPKTPKPQNPRTTEVLEKMAGWAFDSFFYNITWTKLKIRNTLSLTLLDRFASAVSLVASASVFLSARSVATRVTSTERSPLRLPRSLRKTGINESRRSTNHLLCNAKTLSWSKVLRTA